MRNLILICFLAIKLPLSGQSYSEILGRPTNNSITVSVMFNLVTDVYIEYGTVEGVYPFSTTVITSAVDIPDEIELTGLLSNTKYYYRTRYRLSGTGSYSSSPEHSFITQRASGSTFTFTVETDIHLYDKKGCSNLYSICLANQAADNPDFMINMGDTYGDDRDVPAMTNEISDSLHKYYRPFLGQICHSVPYFFCMGNHEGEFDYYLNQNPPDNIAVWGTLWRKFYYANPFPNGFYSGNTDIESFGMGYPENYYAFTWGDALFVVLDAYRYQSISDTTPKPTKWDWTLGIDQYTWLKNTLENSTSQFKFVFAHHVSGQGRGGVIQADLFEWGGHDQNGNYRFDTYRPGWAKPIHQLFVDNGVNIFFQGHDHLFAREVKDGVIYQEVPMASDSTYTLGMIANASAYTSDTLDGSGHLRVTVSPLCVHVDYVRAYLPADTISGVHHNREVAFSYEIGNCPTNINDIENSNVVSVYPNPTNDYLNIENALLTNDEIISVFNIQGEIILQQIIQQQKTEIEISNLTKGVYILKIESEKGVVVKRFIKE